MANSKATKQDDLPQASHVFGVSMSPNGPYLSTTELHAPVDLSLVTVVVQLSDTGTEVVSTAVTLRSAGMGPVKVYVGDTANTAYADITEISNIPVQVRVMVEPRVLYRWFTAAKVAAEEQQTYLIHRALQKWSDAADPVDESGLPDDGEYQTVPSTNELPVETVDETAEEVVRDVDEAPFDADDEEYEEEVDGEEYEEVDDEEVDEEEVDEEEVEYEEVDEEGEEYEEVDEADEEYEEVDEEEYDEDDEEGLTDEDITNLINEVQRMKTIDGVLEVGRNIGMTDARCRNRTKTLAGIKRNVIRELQSIAAGEEE